MDFTPGQEHTELAALARQILTDRVSPGRLREVDATGVRFDRELWAELAGAGVLSATLPVPLGGAGLGLVEQCGVLAEVGRAVAPVPYFSSIAVGAAALARFGTADQQRLWAAPAGRGELVIAAALAEEGSEDPAGPATTAQRSGDGWLVTGAKTAVLAGVVADLLLVPASTGEGTAVFLVAPGDAGVAITPQQVTGGDATCVLRLSGARVPADRVLGGGASPGGRPPAHPGTAVVRWLADRATLGLCALQLCVTERALELTAAYARHRQQFGKPIGSFQAVAQRLADGYIDVEAIKLTLWQAAWRMAAGLPHDAELATAKFWAAEGGHRVAHTAVHVHGGVGIDTDGDVHRYFAAATHNEFALGGATAQLRRIGGQLARAGGGAVSRADIAAPAPPA